MRNTSNPIKENSHVMNAQGGEKKVMKKILSVALSTAMAFSMFASVAFGDTATSPQQQFDALKAKGIFNGYPDGTAGLDKEMTRAEFAKVITKLLGLKEITGVYSYTDKNYNAKNWAAPFIEAVTAAGIMEGKNTEKKIFDFNGKVTIEEMATILTRALDLEVPTETNNTASTWAKGYVQAAINAGLLDSGLNFQSNASRELLVGAAYAVDQEQSLKVSSYEVTEAGKVVTFKMSDGESVKVTLDKALEANKETEVKFTYKEKEFTEKVTYKTTVAQKVASVVSSNLVQVEVKFDGTVDAATAEEESNYEIDNGDVQVDKATLSADKTTVTLLLEENDSLDNKVESKLVVSNVTNADGTVTFNSTVNFTPSDVTAPTVAEVVGLGTKAVKIKFSEPIQRGEAVTASNYEIDGAPIAASIQYSYPDTVILTTNLTVGKHAISVSDVKDFSGQVIAPIDNSFEVTEDTAAPEIVSVKSNDLTEVEITFNETIKSVGDVYANSTATSAQDVEINDNVVTVTFDQNSPLNYTNNTIYIKGATDYSGNSADRSVSLTPTLDTVRPTILKVEDFDTNNAGEFEAVLKFSEKLDQTSAENAENYVLKDSDGDVVDGAYTDSKGHPELDINYNPTDKTVTINFGTDLDENEKYTLTVSGVKDTAVVANTMLPQTVTLDTSIATTSKIEDSWTEDGYLYVDFNTTLATSGSGSALEAEKYAVKVGNTTYSLKDDSKVRMISSDVVRLTVKDFENLTTTDLVGAEVQVSYVKDSAGNYLTQGSSYTLTDVIGQNTLEATGGEVKSTTEVTVDFNKAVSSVTRSDFSVNGNTPTSYSLSSDKKTLTLKFTGNNELNKVGPYALDIVANPTTTDAYGKKLTSGTVTLKDKIAPTVNSNFKVVESVTGSTYEITFTASENINIPANTFTPAYINDLFTVKVNGVEVAVNSVDATGTELTLKFNRPEGFINSDLISVSFDSKANVIVDGSAGNKLASFSASRRYEQAK
ncbi:Ig-like domain-containing protein [Paenibacillus xylanilyticus]|uniref:Ig-like domain-containing protein n=1 Tax=Paenibacillus xylanilyticus TaxID=248903 RepID=UPI0039A10489